MSLATPIGAGLRTPELFHVLIRKADGSQSHGSKLTVQLITIQDTVLTEVLTNHGHWTTFVNSIYPCHQPLFMDF